MPPRDTRCSQPSAIRKRSQTRWLTALGRTEREGLSVSYPPRAQGDVPLKSGHWNKQQIPWKPVGLSSATECRSTDRGSPCVRRHRSSRDSLCDKRAAQAFERDACGNQVLGTDTDELRDSDFVRSFTSHFCADQDFTDFSGQSVLCIGSGAYPTMNVPVGTYGPDRVTKNSGPIQCD